MRLIPALAMFLLISCTPHDDEPDRVEIPFFFVATINSQTIGFAGGDFQDSLYSNMPYSETTQLAADTFYVHEGTSIVQAGNNAAARVGITGMFDHLPSADERRSMFFTGFHPFASDTAGGAAVYFRDGNGVEWSTLNHAQSDTSFRIEMLSPLSDTAATALFQASFSCRLFNAAGDSLNLVNGSVRGKLFKP